MNESVIYAFWNDVNWSAAESGRPVAARKTVAASSVFLTFSSIEEAEDEVEDWSADEDADCDDVDANDSCEEFCEMVSKVVM